MGSNNQMSSWGYRSFSIIFAAIGLFAALSLDNARAQAIAPPIAVSASNNSLDELRYRVSLGRAEDVKLLISQGLSAQALSADNVPLLCVAASRKDPEAVNVVLALLEKGANVNAKDTNGQTALYYAARSGNKEMVELLLRKGIDYYSLDNFGDIARTIAYRAERQDIVDTMDNFVKSQSQTIAGMNESVQKMIDEQKKPISNPVVVPTPSTTSATPAPDKRMSGREKLEAAMKEIEDRRIAEEKAQLQKQKAKEDAENKALREKQAAERKAQKEKEDAKKREEFARKLEETVYSLSYNACAFQYWSYCQAAKQTTDLGEKSLFSTIDNHKTQVESYSVELMKLLNADRKYVEDIIEPSKKRIFDQLDAYPSRTARRSDGVGNMSDMQKRCEVIATAWKIEPPKSEKK